MDILSIDAVSFAARVAHVAAGELYGLLKTGEARAVVNWYDPAGDKDLAAIDGDLADMAAYCAGYGRDVGGERLYRYMAGRIRTAKGGFADEDLARCFAFELFAGTAAKVAADIATSQQVRSTVLALEATEPVPLKLEDSIFEPEEGLGTLRPEAVAAARHEAEAKRQARVQRKLEQARKRAERDQEKAKAATAPVTRQLPPVRLEKGKPAPLSVGEAPPSPPVNRGGRGHRKEEPAPGQV